MGDLLSEAERPKWKTRLAPTLLVLGVVAAIGVAISRARTGDARCDIAALEAQAPDLDAVALDDASLRALGGEAWADILDQCEAIDGWTEHRWRLQASELAPRVTAELSLDLSGIPPAVIRQQKRACAGDFEANGEVPNLPGDWRPYATFEICKLETFGILSSRDVDYVEPGYLADWRIRQLLIDSGVPEPLADRYFTAILLALEIRERAPGNVRLHDDVIEIARDNDSPLILDLPLDGEPLELALEAFDFSSSYVANFVSIAATEPIGELRWLLDAELAPEVRSSARLTIAISEREQLLRPLRASLDLPDSTLEQPADLELTLDGSGAWRRTHGAEQGSNADALAPVIAALQPSSLRVRTSESTPASRVVDLLRVADVWRARNRRELKLWLVVESDPA